MKVTCLVVSTCLVFQACAGSISRNTDMEPQSSQLTASADTDATVEPPSKKESDGSWLPWVIGGTVVVAAVLAALWIAAAHGAGNAVGGTGGDPI